MRLIFVYNAMTGKANAVLDSMHKILSPNTYGCKLCEITFGIFTENNRWKQFRENSDTPMIFYHKNEFVEKYKDNASLIFDFPIILREEDDNLNVFISTKRLNEIETVDALISELKNRIAQS